MHRDLRRGASVQSIKLFAIIVLCNWRGDVEVLKVLLEDAFTLLSGRLLRAIHVLMHAAFAVDILAFCLQDEAWAHAHSQLWHGMHLVL